MPYFHATHTKKKVATAHGCSLVCRCFRSCCYGSYTTNDSNIIRICILLNLLLKYYLEVYVYY
jgi:hypothetical protein